MLDTSLTFDGDYGPKMVGPDKTPFGYELSQVETRAIDYAAIDFVQQLVSQGSKHIRVLDLGCGTGYNAERFARMGCDVTAVDLRHSHDDIAQRNLSLSQAGLTAIQFINQNIIALDIAAITTQPWDVVFLNRVLHFVPEGYLKPIMQAVINNSGPDAHFVINFRSSDYKTGDREGRTFREDDEDGCLPSYFLHNARDFVKMLKGLGCSVAMHEEHDRLCLLFIKNSPVLEHAATLAPVHPSKRQMPQQKQSIPEVIISP
ncbi:MAG: methyltransferase domain-containing protein [Alphaproteobacteria bacterium]|nr:methyltransferase domain-containing protein [Alphaproteobacteria bacterium]